MAREVLSSEAARGRRRAGTGTPRGDRTHPAGRAKSRLGDRLRARRSPTALAVACLVVLPVLVYGIPGMAGHPVFPGDDFTQSLPLRELVGSDLRAGHLPILDPYIWSGAQLLAGWNAGAAYPLTWLFVVLPATAAWTLNVIAIALVAGLTMFAFLRACRLGVVASFLGALTFAFGGAMSAQVQHLGLVVGMSWVPLALLAVLELTEPERTGLGSRLGWTAVLAAAVGLVVLAGEPRAVANAGVVLTLYALWRLVRLSRRAGLSQLLRRWTAGDDGARAASPATAGWSLGTVVLGAALGLGLGAIQLLPGLAAVATSQRATVTHFLYSAGSFPPHWLALFGVPDLLGGSGSFGQPGFFATFNLAEVTAYMGILPLVAAGALLARRRWRPLPEWVVWYGVGAVGLLLAFATHTPLWHLFIRIPLLGAQRLQSRSIMVTDLALAVLLAYWADTWLGRRRASRAPRAELWCGATPALCVAAVVVVGLAWRAPLLEWMGVPASTARAEGAIAPWLVPFLVLALLAVALLAAGGRLGPRRRQLAMVAFVVVDLVVFSATTVVALARTAPKPSVKVSAGKPAGSLPASGAHRHGRADAGTASTSAVVPIAALHLRGRFAIYDPTLLDGPELTALGPNDANVVAGTYSVEGYGSIVDGTYAAATGTHGVSGTGQDVFAPKAATDGVFDELDTSDVLVPSQYLALAKGTTTPNGAPGTGTRTTPAGGTATWYLGTPTEVSSATLSVETTGTGTTSGTTAGSATRTSVIPSLRVGLLQTTGRVVWGSNAVAAGAGASGGPRHATWHANWAHPTRAVALVVRTTAASTIGAPEITTAGGGQAALDGSLQGALEPPHWVYAGSDGAFAIYRDTRAKAPLTLRAVASDTLGAASVRRRTGPALQPASATVSSPHGVEVVRAVAAIPGWTAEWQPAGSTHATPLEVRRSGVVQVVTVPAGTGVVTWRYAGPGVAAGEALSGGALVVVAGFAIAAAWLALAVRRRPRAATAQPTVAPGS